MSARFDIRWDKPQQRYLVLDRVRSLVVASFNTLPDADAFVAEQRGGTP